METETDAERQAGLKKNLDYVLQQKTLVHGDNAHTVATGMLRVLGFDEIGEKAPLSSLSGGLRMRVALACAFFIDPDLLLLDGMPLLYCLTHSHQSLLTISISPPFSGLRTGSVPTKDLSSSLLTTEYCWRTS